MLSPSIWDVNIHCLTLVIRDNIIIEDKALSNDVIKMGIYDARKHL